MSERKAKQIRKEEVKEPHKKKADKKTIWFRVISIVLIVALAGLAGYAIGDSIKTNKADTANTETTQTTDESDTQSNVDTSTLAGVAESMGITYDELVEKWGLDAEKFSSDMAPQEAYNQMTLENIAKMSEMEVNEFKKQYNLPDDVDTTLPNIQLATDVMMKAYGIPYTIEDLQAYGLAETIKADTPWGDAQEAVMTAANAKMSAEQQAQSEDNADAAADTADTADNTQTDSSDTSAKEGE